MSQTNASNTLCPYFLHNACRFGDKCRYSHDLKNAPTDDICRYYQFGACSYGSRCRYRHVKRNKPPVKPEVGLGRPKTFSTEGVESAEPVVHHEAKPPETFAELLKSRSVTKPICPFYQLSGCCMVENCQDVHGDYCVMCQQFALDPNSAKQRAQHEKECSELLEEKMEEAFAYQRSADKVCSICLEKVLDKPNKAEARFGLLQNCNHVFCLGCIRKWRAARNEQLKNRVVKACPECRQTSDFVTPSPYWFEDQADKERIIEGYKKRIADIDCSHFNRGKGQCPFADRCFYRHRYEDGTEAKLGEPGRKRAINSDGELVFSDLYHLIDFLEADDEERSRARADLEQEQASLGLYDSLTELILERELAELDSQ